MKTFRYFLGMMLLASIVGLGSCSDNDDTKKPNFNDVDYPDAPKVAGKITIFAQFETAPCDDVVLIGSHADWNVDNSYSYKFVPAGVIDGINWGAEGWWKITVDVGEITYTVDGVEYDGVLAAKPVQLKGGIFDPGWAHQVGYPNHDPSMVVVKSGGVDVVRGYPNECDIYFTSNATAAIVFKTWKKNPCEPTPKHNYTFSVTVPAGTPGDAVVRIVGSMNGWSVTDDTNILTKGADGKYSITLNGVEEGAEYKYVLNGSWDFEELLAGEEGADCAKALSENRRTGDADKIADTVENWRDVTIERCP